MPTLYIANTTKQAHDFVFRIAGDSRLHRSQIPPGAQRTVWSNPTAEMIASVVAQHEKYGLVDARRIDQTRAFVGLCFSVDRPVNLDQLLKVIEQNEAALDARGKTIRREAAATIWASRREDEVGDDSGAKLKNLQVEIVEDTKPDTVGFEEHIEVRADGIPPKKRAWFGLGAKR